MHLAVLLGNHFNPTALGFEANKADALMESVSRMMNLKIESASLYIVKFVSEREDKRSQAYAESLSFYLRTCYRMNEFLKHADFMSPDRGLSHTYKYMQEDIIGSEKFSHRYPDQIAYFDPSYIEDNGADVYLERVQASFTRTEVPQLLTVKKATNFLSSVLLISEQ